MSGSPNGDPSHPSVVGEIREAVTELDTVDPVEPTTDLEQIGEKFANATVIGLGEPSHGTREVFQFKHRIFRYLVEKYDCRLFAIEANFSDALSINEYVTDGTDTAKERLISSNFHGPWKCKAVLDLIEWVRAFNKRNPDDQIRFHGFDMQHNSQTASMLASYLDTVDPKILAEVKDDLNEIESSDVEQSDEETLTIYADVCKRVSSTLAGRFAERKSEYIGQTSPHSFERARHQVRLLEQAGRMVDSAVSGEQWSEQLRIRDEAMAENVAWLLEYESEDTVAIWAHNAHIKRGAVAGGLFAEIPSMGENLTDTVDYLPLGFSIESGGVRSYSHETDQFERYHVPDPPEGSLPSTLGDTGIDIGYLDLTQFSEGPVEEYLASEPSRHSITGEARDGDPINYVESDPSIDFDGLVFVRESTPAVGLDET